MEDENCQDRQHPQPVALPEGKLGDGLAGHGRAGRHDRLDHAEPVGLERRRPGLALDAHLTESPDLIDVDSLSIVAGYVVVE